MHPFSARFAVAPWIELRSPSLAASRAESHTFASLMIAAGANSLQLAEAMGHRQDGATGLNARVEALRPSRSRLDARLQRHWTAASRRLDRNYCGISAGCKRDRPATTARNPCK